MFVWFLVVLTSKYRDAGFAVAIDHYIIIPLSDEMVKHLLF